VATAFLTHRRRASPQGVLHVLAGARLGLYEPIKRLLGADADPSFLKNVAAGSASGGLAAVICNPTELVKVHCCRQSFFACRSIACVAAAAHHHIYFRSMTRPPDTRVSRKAVSDNYASEI